MQGCALCRCHPPMPVLQEYLATHLPVPSLQAIVNLQLVTLGKCKSNHAVPSHNCSQGLAGSSPTMFPWFPCMAWPFQHLLWHPSATVAFLQLLKCAGTLPHSAFTCHVLLPHPHLGSLRRILIPAQSVHPSQTRKSLSYSHTVIVPLRSIMITVFGD